MSYKRKPELSMLNVLFCLTVIFIHVISYAVAALKPGTLGYTLVMIPWRLSSFVVQGFIILAGLKLFLNKKDTLSFPQYIRKRIIGIIIPYTICFGVYYIAYMLVYRYPADIAFILKNYFTGSLACHLYFIPLIFQFDLLFPLWKKIINKYSPAIVLPLALVFSLICSSYLPQIIKIAFPEFNFIYNDRLFTSYLSYWLIGCYVGKNYDFFCKTVKCHFKPITVIYAFLTVINIVFSCLAYNSIAYVPYMNDIHSVYIIYTCLFLFILFLKLGDRDYVKNPIIFWLDKSSLYIYLYHMLVILAVEKMI